MALHGLGSMTLGVPRRRRRPAVLPRVRADRIGAGRVRDPRRRRAAPRRRAPRPPVGRGDAGRRRSRRRRPHRGRRHRPRSRRHRPTTNGSISVLEPVVGIRVRVAVRDRITQAAHDIATDERSGQHGARRRSGAGDLRRGPGSAAPARSRAVGHARHRGQQALPRRRARLPVERRVGRHHRLPALLARPSQRRADQLAGAVLPPLVVAGRRRRRDRPRRTPPARRPTRRATCGVSAGTSSAPTCSGTSATRPATSPSTSPTSTRSATTTRGSPATGHPTSRCTRGVRRSPATSSNHRDLAEIKEALSA